MDSPAALPFKSVLKISDQEHEKALKAAFYNTTAILFVFFAGVIVVSAYYVLEMFLRPLIWATLCGAFIFPFKKAFTKVVRDWLASLENDHIPLAIGFSVLPFKAVNRSADVLGLIVKSNTKLLIFAFVVFIMAYFLIIYQPYYYIFLSVDVFHKFISTVLMVFSYPLVVWSIVLGFVVLLFYYKHGEEENTVTQNEWWLKYVSLSVWCVFLFHLVTLAGPVKVPLAILLIVLIVLGVMDDNKKYSDCPQETINKEIEEDEEPINQYEDTHSIRNVWSVADVVGKFSSLFRVESLPNLHESHPGSSPPNKVEVKVAEGGGGTVPKFVTPTPMTLPNTATQKKRKKSKARKKSDPFFIALFWLFAISRFWLHPWLLQFIPVLLLILGLKVLVKKLELDKLLIEKTKHTVETATNFYEERADIIVPGPVRGIMSTIQIGDKKVVGYLRSSTDFVMTIFIMISLAIVAVFLAVFCCVQIHHESSYLVTVATNVVNKTIVSNQEYLSWMNLNETQVRKTMDTAIHKAYMMARQRVATMISSVIKTNSTSSPTKDVESDVTNLLDQLYQTWVAKEGGRAEKTKPITKETVINDNWNQQWKKYSNYFSVSEIVNLLKENVHTFQSVVDSIWTIFKGNMNLAISLVTHIISIVLSSSTYLLNSMVSLVVFCTTLFYLLGTSGDEYKVITWFSNISLGTSFADSINQAVQDVFGASLKMSVFYGIYTWFTHSMFAGNLIFIPTAFAAILGMVPFIGTYWAAVPACFELWLIENEGMRALLLLVIHFLPTYVVDSAIYSDIGIHPYLTALSIAGGVVYAGLEGAFIGPFVLVCLVVAMDVYGRLISVSSTPTTSSRLRTKELRRAISEEQCFTR